LSCTGCRIRFISSSMWFLCCLRMQIIWHAALSSSHHAMRCCHRFGKNMCYVSPPLILDKVRSYM
jgi:hypothetical protein